MMNVVSEIRRKFGITQEELAHVLGVSFTSVNAWEGGKRIPQEHMMTVLTGLLESDQLPKAAPDASSKGFSRTGAGFVSSLLDYNGLHDPLPYTHGIGRWYGSLPSFLVSDVIKFIQTDFGKSGPVLANFCGSGTIPLEASLHGMPGYGIDVNPLSVMLSNIKTKIASYSFDELTDAFQAVKENRGFGEAPGDLKNFLWSDNKWFPPEVKDVTRQLCSGISKLEQYDLQCIFSVALATIIVNYCNIDKRCTNHYVYKANDRFDRNRLEAELYSELTSYYSAIQSLKAIPGYKSPSIQLGNACNLPFLPESMEVVFSHPPYGTTINYYSISRIPLSVLESISFREKEIEPDASRCKSQDISSGTLNRFNSFTQSWVKEAYRVLKNKGIFVSIIGDSRDGGKLSHPFTEIIACGEKAGFTLKELFIWVTNHKSGMHVKRKGNHIDHNYVIIMEK